MKASSITRYDIINFPFPYKLWLAVNSDSCAVLGWNDDGTVLLIDLVALDAYLNSMHSIFKIKNSPVFLQHLDEFKFHRLNATPEPEEDILLQYKNEYFQRHRLDLLGKIRRYTYQLTGEMKTTKPCDSASGSANANATNANAANANATNANAANANATNANAANSQLQAIQPRSALFGDLCSRSYGGLSKMQKTRIRFQTIFNYHNESRVLQKKLQICDDHVATSLALAQAGVIGRFVEEPLIILPAELYENPFDSVIQMDPDFCPEFAGYYGIPSREQLLHFFGSYLPVYVDSSMLNNNFVAETSSSIPNCINSNAEYRLEQHQPINGNDKKDTGSMLTLPPLKVKPSQPKPTLDMYAGLQPIFHNDDEDGLPTVNKIADKPADLSVESSINFNGSGVSDIKMEIDGAVKIGNRQKMPFKAMEITDEKNSENQENFRSFFNQYRSALNLLYGR